MLANGKGECGRGENGGERPILVRADGEGQAWVGDIKSEAVVGNPREEVRKGDLG